MNNVVQKSIFNRAAVAVIVTFVLNTLGTWLGLYSIFFWYDMPMHFLGGLFTGLLCLSFILRIKVLNNLSFGALSLVVIVSVLCIGLAWEVYELFVAYMVGDRLILLDSMSDICFDLAGGIQALFIYDRQVRIVNRKNNK